MKKEGNTMFRMIAVLSLLSFSSLFANDTISDVISEIEVDRSAKCEFVKSSSAFCLSYLCFSKKTYSCISNESDFNVELKVKENTMAGTNTYVKVRSVKIIE